MTIDEFLSALINIQVELEATREVQTKFIVSETVDAVTSRVINQGANYEGRPFPPYSDKNVSPWAFFTRPGEKRNTTRTDQVKAILEFQKAYGDQTNYKNWREFHGLPTEYKNFTFTEDMWKSLRLDLIDVGPNEAEWGVTSSDAQNLDVLLKHQSEYDLMLLHDSEIDLLHQANQDRIADIITKELDQYD